MSETATTTEVKRPSDKAIDELVLAYAVHEGAAKGIAARLKLKQTEMETAKAAVIAAVQSFGVKHAEKSKRLEGQHNTATITTGTRTETVGASVDVLKAYLEKTGIPQLRERFFEEHVSYSLVEGPGDVLKTLDLKARVRNKIDALVKACFKIQTNAPSLKVSVVVPEKV